MGIQINGQTDTITATDGSFTIQGASGNLTGDLVGNVTGNLTGNVNSTGVTTVTSLRIGTGASISSPATNVLALGTNNVESVRIDSSGNVGINTANPQDKLTVLGKIHVHQNSGSENRIILRGQPSSSYRWNIDNYSSSNTFRIYREDDATSANGAVAMSIDASTRNVTISGGNLAFDSGKGIDFSATSNSSGTMTSELFDDYEEGTFTVTPNTNLTLDSLYTSWFYTKIGRQVTISGLFRVSSVSGTNGVTGSLPFVSATSPANGTGAYAGGTMSTGIDIGDAGMAWYIAGSGANAFTFYRIYDNGGWDQLPNSALAPGDEIYATMTYFTD